MSNPTDAVRPGSSDALTARTIDATVPPPLTRAQETVVALGPRITESVTPLSSPLVLGTFALTLLFVLVARRLKYQPSAIVLGVLLVAGLTSFRPMPKWELQPRVTASSSRPKTVTRASRPYWYPAQPAAPAPEVLPPDDGPFTVVLPKLPRAPETDVSMELMRRAEEMMRDNEQVREMMEQLRYRIQQEARSRRWRRLAAKYRAHHEDFDPIGLVYTR
jgi:hypothetical protein